MITGYNTDVVHDAFSIMCKQEDKGLEKSNCVIARLLGRCDPRGGNGRL